MVKALLLLLAVLPVAALPMPWRIERQVGEWDGARRCAVVALTGELRAVLTGPAGGSAAVWSVRVGFDNQPGSLRYLRIGRRMFQTERERFEGAAAAEIVARLGQPDEFVLEWFASPDAAKRGGLYETGDFAQRAEACEAWVTGRRV